MKYVVDKQILIAPELAFTMGVTVGNTGVTAVNNANSPYNGRKMIFAGTPVGAANNVFANRATVLKAMNDANNATSVAGVLLHNVDVTEGNVSTAMVVKGIVDTDKIDVTVDANVATALKGNILFMKGDAQ